MSLHGKLIVNNEPLAPLTFDGVGTFQAFSGNNQYRNRAGCTAVEENGPIPAGKYWIVERPVGGLYSQAKTHLTDTFNRLFKIPSNHTEWFALYRDDGKVDDYTWVNNVKRGQFRLHPIAGRGISTGCITLQSQRDFIKLRHSLLHTSTIPIRCTGMNAYGTIEVIAHGNTCP